MDARVIPDLSASADVLIASDHQTTLAPLGAIFRDEPGGPAYVFVEQPAGWNRRRVELGVASNIMTAVRSGLNAGEVVALERPAAPVREAAAQ